MEEIIAIILDAIKDAPDIIASVEAAFQKKGYSNAEINGIFNGVIPYEKLGIDPNHPVAPEPGSTPAPAAAAPHILARPNPQPQPDAPAPSTTPAPHVAAR